MATMFYATASRRMRLKAAILFILFTQLSVIAVAQNVTQPLANPKAVIHDGHTRFTVLTPRLIRM